RVLVASRGRAEWRQAAVRAGEWARRELWRAEEKRLWRRHRAGEADIDAYCEDYTYLAWGAIELFQATADGSWLNWAIELTDAQTVLFHDERDGGWFSTTGTDASVLLRL